MKTLFIVLVILSALPYSSRSQEITKEELIKAGIAKYKTLSPEEIAYLEKKRKSEEVISAIKSWEDFNQIKLSKSAYAELVAEYNISILSLSKFANQKQLDIDETTLRSMGPNVLQQYLVELNADTVNEMACLWTWDLPPLRDFFKSPYYRFHPDKKSTKMNNYGPVMANVYGFVQIECNVPEGEIYMDNVAQERYTDQKLVVPVGIREFQITKEGYNACKQKITVKKGKTEKLSCALESSTR